METFEDAQAHNNRYRTILFSVEKLIEWKPKDQIEGLQLSQDSLFCREIN